MRSAHRLHSMSTEVTPRTMSLTERVAEEIRVAMVRRRMSGAALARILGVSPAWISYRLTGTQPIDLNDLDKIATALGVEVLDLVSQARPRAAGSNKDVSLRRGSGYAHATTRPVVGRPPNRPAYSQLPAGQRRPSKVRP